MTTSSRQSILKSKSRDKIIDDLLLAIVDHIEDRDNLDAYRDDRWLVETIKDFKDYYYEKDDYNE